MKRVLLTLACLLVLLTFTLPAVGFAVKAVRTTAVSTGTTTAVVVTPLIVFPEAPPDATAAEAKATTPWSKEGDMLNLFWAVSSLGACVAIIVWGVLASRKTGAPA